MLKAFSKNSNRRLLKHVRYLQNRQDLNLHQPLFQVADPLWLKEEEVQAHLIIHDIAYK